MGGFIEFCRTIGTARLAAMGAVAVGLIGFFVFLMLRISQPQMTTLFSELPIDDSSSVIAKLEGLNVPFELRNEGSTILVPKDRVLRLRMSLAADGLPTGGMVGYEIFDKGDTLGATSFVQNLNHLRALEGELARTIRSLDRVQMARVHLVLPKRQLFARDKSEPTASIVLKMRGGLDRGQIRAIQHLVASAVKDLKPSRVSLVDENGTLLASGSGDRDQSGIISSFEERNQAFELRAERELEQIVNRIVGENNSRIQVTAEIDYNRITQTSDTFDPDGQVVRSTQTREESSDSQDAARNDAVTVGNELPGANAGGENAAGARQAASKNEEVVNYEISKTTKTEITEAGRIKRLSVAVLVDGVYNPGADNTAVYAPRSKEQLDQISALVRTAIGFDAKRGDQIEVVNLQFAQKAPIDALADEEKSMFDFSKEDYFYIAELSVLLIVSLLVLLFVVRPLVRRIITPEEPAGSGVPGIPQLVNAAGEPIDGVEHLRLVSADGSPIPDGSDGQSAATPENKAAAMIDYAQVAGEAHGQAVAKVAELIKGNPDEAVAIVRQWLQEEPA